MCGIAGMLGPSDATAGVIGPMLDVIHHRGPDDSGTFIGEDFAFGMTRLAIIDIAGGHQPMWSEDGSVGIVYNGELYNYRELNDELSAAGRPPRSHSDTETILRLYEEQGRDDLSGMLRRLRGMFAFCLYDAHRRQWILARDPFGIKPLYVRLDPTASVPTVAAFASEIKSLLVDPAVDAAIDRQAIINYLSFQFNPLPQTFFEGILRLEPAHVAIIDLDDPVYVPREYWRYEFASPSTDEAALTAEVRAVLEDSLQHHLIADVPVGAFLSGGIDSAITVTLVQQARAAQGLDPVKTFTVGFDAVSEHAQAREVADRLGTDHHEIHVDLADYLGVLPDIAWYFDEPVADPSAVSLYFVARAAREHVTVVLSGEGADELFGGYRIYREPMDLDRLRRLPSPVRRLAAALGRSRRHFPGRNYLRRATTDFAERYIGNAYVFRPGEVQELLGSATPIPHVRPADVLTASYPDFDSLPEARRMQLVDMHFWLRGDILAKADRMTMAHSLELRVPYLDPEVSAVSARIPDDLKYRDGTTKWLLRRAFRGRIPAATEQRAKLGFPTPLRHWLSEDPDAVLAPIRQSAFLAGLLDMSVVERLARDHAQGRTDASRRIFVLLMLALWHDAFFGGPVGVKPSERTA